MMVGATEVMLKEEMESKDKRKENTEMRDRVKETLAVALMMVVEGKKKSRWRRKVRNRRREK